MAEWVNCTGINGASIIVNLDNILTITSFGTGTRLALSGNSQTYDVAEAPTDVLSLPRIGKQDAPRGSSSYVQEQSLSHTPDG